MALISKFTCNFLIVRDACRNNAIRFIMILANAIPFKGSKPLVGETIHLRLLLKSCANDCQYLVHRACISILVRRGRTFSANSKITRSRKNFGMTRSSIAIAIPIWPSNNGNVITIHSCPNRPSGTARQSLSPPYRCPHSTEHQTCHSLSFSSIKSRSDRIHSAHIFWSKCSTILELVTWGFI